MVTVTFWGVRGSVPSPGPATSRYGGNTACVVVEAGGGEAPIVLDLGTGLIAWGATQPGPVRARALLSHLHWDHVQGLHHFAPLDRAGTEIEVLGPSPARLLEAVRPPLFPVGLDERAGTVRFVDVDDEKLVLGSAQVLVRRVPHRGRTNGYRIDWRGTSVAYVSDHQAPLALDRVDDAVLELADGVELLVHDAQYTEEEFRARPDWGHSTIDYAVLVARESGAHRLALFHHDPARTDDELDRLETTARRTGDRLGVPVVLVASEGLCLELGG